jgi:hypothetical protein
MQEKTAHRAAFTFVLNERLLYVDTHVSSGTLDHLHGCGHVVGVEVSELLLGDHLDLSLGDGAHLDGVRLAGTALLSEDLEDHLGSRLGLVDELVASVVIDLDDGRDDLADASLGLVIEALYELADVDSGRTERWTQSLAWNGLAARDLKLEHLCNFLCHNGLFSEE